MRNSRFLNVSVSNTDLIREAINNQVVLPQLLVALSEDSYNI